MAIRDIFDAGKDAPKGFPGMNVYVARRDDAEYGIGVINVANNMDALATFTREQMAALRDALNKELAS